MKREKILPFTMCRSDLVLFPFVPDFEDWCRMCWCWPVLRPLNSVSVAVWCAACVSAGLIGSCLCCRLVSLRGSSVSTVFESASRAMVWVCTDFGLSRDWFWGCSGLIVVDGCVCESFGYCWQALCLNDSILFMAVLDSCGFIDELSLLFFLLCCASKICLEYWYWCWN